MRILLLALLTVAVTACGGRAKRSHDLMYDIRAYNEGVRWQKLPQAAVRILPSERDAFLDVREDLEEELRIDDFEIMRLKMTDDTHENANVQIKWTWHMDSRGIVHTTTSKQTWRRFGKRWMMLKEAHVRGDVMPGLPEAGADPALGEEAGEEAEEDVGQKGEQKEQVEAALHAAEKSHRIAQ